MDRQALRFIEMLDDETLDESGDPKISIELRFKLFDKGESWLAKRQKLMPKAEESEGAGITSMREWMNNPATQEALDQLMFDRGYVKMPPKRPGRPTKAEETVRARMKEFKEAGQKDDDSGWQKMLKDDES